MKHTKHTCLFHHRWTTPAIIGDVPMNLCTLSYARKAIWYKECRFCGKQKVFIK